jgi:transposase-like protein
MSLPHCPSRRTGAKTGLVEIFNAEDKDHARKAAKAFAAGYAAKWPKATAKITEHLDVLLAFFDYPAEHWIHLHTANPIESTFATVRLRQRVAVPPFTPRSRATCAIDLLDS